MMALMTLVAMSVNAQALVVKSGNLATMLKKDKTAALKIDFSKAKMANLSKKELKETLFMDFLKESDPETYQIWDKHAKECYDFFAERWNDDKESAKIDDDTSADSTSNGKYDYIDIGNGAAATWSWSRKSGGVMMRGTVQVTDANGSDVCTVDVNDFRGNSTRGFDMKMPTFGRRMALFHKSLAKELLDLAKEQKK